MAKFLIEVQHPAETKACARVVQVFLSTGSHYLTNAEWGCGDGVHKAWMIVDVDDKAAAKAIVPPAFRADATIIKLNRFSLERIDAILSTHSTPRSEDKSAG